MNLNQITAPSLNVSEAILFYQKLGLELIVEVLPHYARFVCPDGNSTFSIHKVDDIQKGEGIHIYFECEDLDEKVADLIAKGIQFDEKPNDKFWLWREARLKDADGNQIILFYGGENRINPPWKIKT
ncbi:MAG: catechol 2,3-dioxygenase-like lactoylglutathione lyase family enzyme [Paraglaciecola sp.]|jgi:catechol 2,3-dioxygenase-like lactoylglutathione lyase family enzyme|uniref:VOC family protein n=1 Tax=Polaribacter sp. TaxID=1920175 RepID=UPI003AC97225